MNKKAKKTKKTKIPTSSEQSTQFRDLVTECYEDVPLLFMTEEVFDDAVVGVAEGIGREPAIAYDYDKVIEANMKMGMTYEDAVEYFNYNQIGAYVGEHTPIFIYRKDKQTLGFK